MALAKIVYASMTGNTEEIADIVASKLEELGVEVQVHECTTIETEDILDADLIVVASYTYSYGGDGELPDEIVDFYADLANLDLTGKVYGVCGSGDTFYDDFCSAVDDFDVMLGSRGATKGAENVKVDLAAEDKDIVNLEQFATDLVAKLDTLNQLINRLAYQQVWSVFFQPINKIVHLLFAIFIFFNLINWLGFRERRILWLKNQKWPAIRGSWN